MIKFQCYSRSVHFCLGMFRTFGYMVPQSLVGNPIMCARAPQLKPVSQLCAISRKCGKGLQVKSPCLRRIDGKGLLVKSPSLRKVCVLRRARFSLAGPRFLYGIVGVRAVVPFGTTCWVPLKSARFLRDSPVLVCRSSTYVPI